MEAEELIKQLLLVIKEEHIILKEFAENISRIEKAAENLSSATHRQTDTFILQINKLSKRLDQREEDCRKLEEIAISTGHRLDRVMDILHDATKTQPTNQYNNM